MKNQNYDASALALAIQSKIPDVQWTVGILTEMVTKLALTGDEYDQHAHDHAAERLEMVGKTLISLGKSVTSLAQYTNYPPVTE